MNATKSLMGVFLAALLLSACSGTTAPGPRAWIDKPLDGITAPVAPITVIAHAADNAGVSEIEFYVNGAFQVSVGAGGERLGSARWEFSPPAPGVYQLQVAGINSAGETGAPATSTITISGNVEQEAPPAAEETPTETQPPPTEITPTLVTPTSTEEIPDEEIVVSFYASPAEVEAGSCTTLHWDVEGSEKVYWNGASVYFRGMEERCPCEDETHHLEVVKLDGSKEEYWVTITVHGSCVQVPTDTPPPPPDETPPVIYNAQAGPATIYLKGCGGHEQIVKVAAVIVDAESEIGSVIAYWSIAGGESGQVSLQAGGLGYWAEIGPVSTKGTMEIIIVAKDALGNSAQSNTLQVTVKNCIN